MICNVSACNVVVDHESGGPKDVAWSCTFDLRGARDPICRLIHRPAPFVVNLVFIWRLSLTN